MSVSCVVLNLVSRFVVDLDLVKIEFFTKAV